MISKSLMLFFSFTVIAMVFIETFAVPPVESMNGGNAGLLGLNERSQAVRRIDCKSFCQKTGFNGAVAGCKCGFTLFAKRRDADKWWPWSRFRNQHFEDQRSMDDIFD